MDLLEVLLSEVWLAVQFVKEGIVVASDFATMNIAIATDFGARIADASAEDAVGKKCDLYMR